MIKLGGFKENQANQENTLLKNFVIVAFIKKITSFLQVEELFFHIFVSLNCDLNSKFSIHFIPTSSHQFNPLNPKISQIILLTVCHTIYVMLVWRIWHWINQ